MIPEGSNTVLRLSPASRMKKASHVRCLTFAPYAWRRFTPWGVMRCRRGLRATHYIVRNFYRTAMLWKRKSYCLLQSLLQWYVLQLRLMALSSILIRVKSVSSQMWNTNVANAEVIWILHIIRNWQNQRTMAMHIMCISVKNLTVSTNVMVNSNCNQHSVLWRKFRLLLSFLSYLSVIHCMHRTCLPYGQDYWKHELRRY